MASNPIGVAVTPSELGHCAARLLVDYIRPIRDGLDDGPDDHEGRPTFPIQLLLVVLDLS